MVCLLPHRAKLVVTSVIAAAAYLPLASAARAAEALGLPADRLPLSAYAKLSFYTMRTDAYDRFATRLERRFRKDEIEVMMRAAGLDRIEFRNDAPYWCAVGHRAS
jgi:hypothetical protein